MTNLDTHSAIVEAPPRRACGKLRYPDKKAAITQINWLKKVRGRHGRPKWLRAYFCDECRGWHITKGIDRNLKNPRMFKGLKTRTSFTIKKAKRNIES